MKVSSKELSADKIAHALWLLPDSDSAKIKTQLALFSLWAKKKVSSSETLISDVKTSLSNKFDLRIKSF